MRPANELGVVAIVATAVLVVLETTVAGSEVLVGRSRPVAERVSIDQVDHSAFDALLKKHVDERGMVNYTKWKASPADRGRLELYLSSLSKADPTRRARRAATLAYWINAYNAVTIHGILREYPTTSIRNHTAKVFGYNIWDDLKLTVGSRRYSLNQMEHDVLRKMRDPRIHFAIVCASIGCPKLLNEAYTPAKIDTQLSVNAKAFFADRSKFRRAGNRLQFSPILKWFGEDFGSSTAGQLAAIAPYLPDAEAQRVARSGSASVSYLDYDWGLNDRK